MGRCPICLCNVLFGWFPKVFKCENELVKATLMYLDDPDAPEGVAFIRWLAVQDYLGEKINWKDLT